MAKADSRNYESIFAAVLEKIRFNKTRTFYKYSSNKRTVSFRYR